MVLAETVSVRLLMQTAMVFATTRAKVLLVNLSMLMAMVFATTLKAENLLAPHPVISKETDGATVPKADVTDNKK